MLRIFLSNNQSVLMMVDGEDYIIKGAHSIAQGCGSIVKFINADSIELHSKSPS